MDVRLSPEQQALRDAAAQVVERLGPHAVAQLDDQERVAKLDAAVAASGWRELRAEGDGGNPWASGVEVAVVAEQLGRGLVDSAFTGPTLAAELRRLTGASPATAPETVLLDRSVGGLAVVAGGRAPEGALAADAAGAGTALLLEPVDRGGWRLAQVALTPAAVGVDLTRLMATATVDTVPTTVADQQVALDDDALARWTALGLAATAADLVGTMQGAVDLACAYAAERRQYGAPIGSFQAVQHLLADAFVATEGARSAALHAAWAVDALAPHEALVAGAVAKAYAGRAARTACETGIQVHGGIGNTWECLAHAFLRRALLSTDLLGGVDANLARVLAAHGIATTDGAHDGLR
jgi:alkylation response protein AidB-like acyl-CoA dehydrogenase